METKARARARAGRRRRGGGRARARPPREARLRSGGAEAVAHALGADGWSTTVEQSEGAWLVVATRARTLTLELVHETRAGLAALASEHGGLYDGWEAPTA